MSSNPKDMFACAQAIADAAQSEANFRSAISRAYYAGYHAAKLFHDALPVPGSGNGANGVHEILVQQLYHPGVKKTTPEYAKSIGLGKFLHQAKILRVQSDYHVGDVVTTEQMT